MCRRPPRRSALADADFWYSARPSYSPAVLLAADTVEAGIDGRCRQVGRHPGGGTRAQTILNNHRAKLIGTGTADHGTLDYVTRILGDHDVRQHSTTAGQEGRASTTQ